MAVSIYNAQNDELCRVDESAESSVLANKKDISSIIASGTTNGTGSTITSGTWFYLNGELCRAKTDIAANATFTLNTNYEKKTAGEALSELNSKIVVNNSTGRIDISSYSSGSNPYICNYDGYALIVNRGSSDTSKIDVNGANDNYITSIQLNNVIGSNSVFVRKGMKLVCSKSGSTSDCYFSPMSYQN